MGVLSGSFNYWGCNLQTSNGRCLLVADSPSIMNSVLIDVILSVS